MKYICLFMTRRPGAVSIEFDEIAIIISDASGIDLIVTV